jgi:flavin reductase (DIM6/NTAB) family NADH-FMN oxidoreductase RutF
MDVSPLAFRDALGRFASGVTVVTVPHAASPAGVRGITANAFMSVSLEPPLVLVSIDKKARAHAPLVEAERYGVSILREDQAPLSNHFAGFDDSVTPRFTELGGIAVLDGALAQLACRIVGRHDAGDHTLFIGQVEALATHEAAPLLYFRGRYGELNREPALKDS